MFCNGKNNLVLSFFLSQNSIKSKEITSTGSMVLSIWRLKDLNNLSSNPIELESTVELYTGDVLEE